ncbi:MAG: histidine phosphatase family protein [Lachnospiraceae bacterium]|nr:histidine phosphatase family protein [Lachnospiraceae bacterium]
MFYLVRHGEPDYSERNSKIYQGFGVNLSPLTAAGIAQIKAAAQDPRLAGADVILSSPYTRALQTAAVLSKELGIEIAVETDLHEWLANKSYIYESDEKAGQSYREYIEWNGVYPQGEEKDWETSAMMRERALRVLEKYRNCGKVIVACHGMLIQAVTGGGYPACGQITEYRLQ